MPKIKLPDDSSNPGPYLGTETQTIASELLHFYRVVLGDKTADLTAGVTAKGTQAGNFLGTQDAKDSGRTLFTAIATAVTGVTTEGLISLTPYRDLVAGGAATTFAVTGGKRLRLQRMQVTWRNNTAAAGGVTCRFRMLAGTVLATSPVHMTVNATTSLATIGSGFTSYADFPDGFELSGTMQFGVTQISVGAVVGFDIQIVGFEY